MGYLSSLASVKKLITEVKEILNKKHLKVGGLFERCYSNTLETTVSFEKDGSVFVITGDIPAMWLRDSAWQMRPYLPLVKEDPLIANLLEKVIHRQISSILIDPYANAFNKTSNGRCFNQNDLNMKPELWERKFEIDSLCFPIELAYLYWKNEGNVSVFDSEFLEAAKSIVSVFHIEQDHENKSPYRFKRNNCIFTDTLSRGGKGALVKSDLGLIWSGFRPSDDACVYGYLIPSNMFAAVILKYLSEISSEIYNDKKFARETAAFSSMLTETIEREAVIKPGGNRFDKPFYAYEIDGFGQFLIMDDANFPSLLSAPYMGYCSADSEIYLNTREIILSEQNPYYYHGKYAHGVGSMHTKSGYIWHMAMGMEGLIAESPTEKRAIIENIAKTDGGTGFLHESFSPDDPAKFSREWFSLANAVFCTLVLDYCGYKIKRH